MDMPGIKKDTTVETILDSKNRACNLTKDSVEEIWNSEFLKDFRMKKINNEYIKFCETCYQEDSMGVASKRQSVIDAYYEDNKHLIDEAKANNGMMTTMPVWWELRLSSICNQACRMCIPQTSSKMRDEFAKFVDELPPSVKKNTEAAIIQYNSHGYLGESEFFLNQFWENIDDIKYLELHGGEPTADKTLWELVEKVVSSGHSKHMHVHVHTNIHSLQKRHIELWDQFRTGWIGVSIDAYGIENEYIRYGSKWSTIENNLKLLKGLGSHWTKWVTSSVMAYNSCTMHKLIDWFIDYTKVNEIDDLWWRMDPVTNPNIMRIEHIPLEYRLSAIDKLTPLIDKANDIQTKHSIQELISALHSTELPTTGSYEELISYTKVLDIKRNQNASEIFPHIQRIFK
jgi:MoaA/NifB/PqqE/SkfB family radical SAM enzyme